MIFLFLFCVINIKDNIEKDWYFDIYLFRRSGYVGIIFIYWMKFMFVFIFKQIKIDYCWLLLYWLWLY